MARRNRPTTGTVLVALALLSAGAVLHAPRPAALVGSLLLAFVLSGAGLTRLLFPTRTAAVTEWLVLIPALSLATLALGGLGMYAAGVALDRDSWLALTTAVAVLAAIAGQVRAWRAGRSSRVAERESRVAPGRESPVAAGRERITFRRAVLRVVPLFVAAALLSGAVWFSARDVAETPTGAFTALEVVPAFASEAPGDTRTVAVGLRCEERGVTEYVVLVRGTGGYRTRLQARLRPGESWARHVRAPTTGRITVDLFRNGETAVYRSVFLENPQ